MTSKITSDVLESMLKCKTKAYLKLTEQSGDKSAYEGVLTDMRAQVRLQALDTILNRQPVDRVEREVSLSQVALKSGPEFILGAVLETDYFLVNFDGLKRVKGSSTLGSFHYVPMLFHEGRSLRREQKQLLALYGMLLAEIQGKQPEVGIVWHGNDCVASTVRLIDLRKDAERIVESVREMQANESKPLLVLNDHCPTCEFRQKCHSQATSEDNLSLLRGVGVKEIKSYARKGIFTVSQLSHTFRPRRKGKRAEPGSHKRHLSLQAMAIRDRTIYVLGSPTLKTSAVRVYFDIEAISEGNFVYLIGIIIVEGETERRFSFWADSKQEERVIFDQFLAVLSQFREFTLYSYGSYETAFLKRMQKVPDLKQQVDKILEQSVNVLSVIYAHVYFPTYSNGLKDIGSCLGCTWADPEATGLQSIVWRTRWEASQDERWKQTLVQYNLDDCAALKVVADQIHSLVVGADLEATASSATSGRFRVASVQDYDQKGRIRKWGTVNFVHPDYAFVNDRAYFSYQRQRVYVRTNRTIRKNRTRPTGYRNRHLAVTRRVEVQASECESCGSVDLITGTVRSTGKRGPRSKREFDLVGTKAGIKLSVIECTSKLHECRSCGVVFVPNTYQRLTRYFHGVKSWAMYQHIAHGLSFGTIKEMIDVFFGLPVPKPELHRFKAEMAWYYEPTCRRLWEKLLAGHLLHVDETQIRLKGGKRGYVWAFTNLEEVVYVFRPNRQGEFLRELLKDFHGVLVSDFYAAYDSLDCPQQKCLIHLIRDMNDDLLANPFENDLRVMTEPFGSLLRSIVASIDEHGLRKRRLRRFKRDVSKFFRLVSSLSPRSDVALSLRERLLKYQPKLFTFLDYDDVPWNNNNAENAIKRFALYRAHASGMMKDSGVQDFLTLLSVCQTCKYKGLNYWRFLSSRMQDFDMFTERTRRKQPTQLEVYPDEFKPLWQQFRPKTDK